MSRACAGAVVGIVGMALPFLLIAWGGYASSSLTVVGLVLILIGVTLASGIALRARAVRADSGLEA